MMIVLQDHVRPVGEERARSRLPLIRVAAFSITTSLRCFSRPVDRARVDLFIEEYWRRIFAAGNARLSVEGRARFDEVGRACVVMSNHRSLLDIPALMGAVPPSLRMVMKEELTRVPIWGPNCVRAGFIPITRADRERAVQQLELAKQRMSEGVHVWISPEGTRSRTGELLPFKKGGFHVATALGAPIMPAYIDGAADVIAADSSVVVADGSVTVTFGPPIETSGRAIEDVMGDVRAALTSLQSSPAR